jgi:hypothetical protein
MNREQLAKQWRERLAAYHPDLGTLKSWCKANDLSLDQYYYWQRRLRPEASPNPPASPEWLSLPAVSPHSQVGAATAALEGSGVSIRIGTATVDVRPGFDTSTLGAVVRVLQESRGC